MAEYVVLAHGQEAWGTAALALPDDCLSAPSLQFICIAMG